ncbi:hypothetical protein PR003_g681 [Phytophthora rubi]|uniref:Uncharacterized protein n=1 Tax=Phytophthora rubi TaxID=129364 RepID=A0A6A3NUP4_9STRA|nr:hypothetical protein PR002_g546 [Phytophthora rubi]KAE9359568.1 hypothetical protein PR003_g681 [Phytophthora rubi]
MEPSCLALCPLASSLALHCDVAHSQLSRSDSSTTAKINNSRKPKTFCGNPDHRQLFHMLTSAFGQNQHGLPLTSRTHLRSVCSRGRIGCSKVQ